MHPAFEQLGWLDEQIVHTAVKNTTRTHGSVTLYSSSSATKRVAGLIRAALKQELPVTDGHAACRFRIVVRRQLFLRFSDN